MKSLRPPHCPQCDRLMTSKGYKKNKSGDILGKRWVCPACKKYKYISFSGIDSEVIAENVRLAKQRQKFQDTNRIERKAFRESARIENAAAEIGKEIRALLLKESLHLKNTISKQKGSPHDNAVGVLHLSDLHFNELVELEHNQYDFGVASRRLKLFTTKAINYFNANNITSVLIAATGDLMNSDRRLDEVLNQATNRSRAMFLAVDILQQVIREIASNFNTTVAYVTGNEGRIEKEPGWSHVMATHNYDWSIFNMLSYLFAETPVHFIDSNKHPDELVVSVAGSNLLLVHGHGSIKPKNFEHSLQQIVGRYGARGIKVDYIISGHVHSARIGDNGARSSSLVGANDYSEKALNLTGRASQNCYVFYDNGNRDGIKIDLQNAGPDGYEINRSLEAYNAKSAMKLKEPMVIHQVVV